MINESKVLEMLGVYANGHVSKADVWLRLTELDATVCLGCTYADAYLTVDQARKLARQLYRLARRVDKRKGHE